MLTQRHYKLEIVKVVSFMTSLESDEQILIRGGSESYVCNPPQANTLVPIYC